ncbi:MAG: hypothetical protein IPL02_04280 [Moraxellaceae bacterium]|mgnify:FL=1|nr:hypothetical protein [Moraxellaceae bacterium]MBK8326290.1 hypothetical protein [Moraxellaceae bacterium]MBK9185351.1 hypothetical protein [Moraxellaceae bacterium]
MNTPSPSIKDLVLIVVSRPDDSDARQLLYRHIKQAQFFLAAYAVPLELKQALGISPLIINESFTKIPLQMATKNGSNALIAYVDLETLQAKAPNHWQIEVTGKDLLNLLLMSPNFDAVILNTAQGWAGITKEEATMLTSTVA